MTEEAVAVAEAEAVMRVVPWWVLLVQGICGLVIGALLLLNPAATTVLLVQFVAIWWMVSGVMNLVSLFIDRSLWGWKLLIGALGILAGIAILSEPLVGTVAFLAVVVIFLALDGLFIGVADIIKAFQGAGWGAGVLGVLSLIFGVLLLARPLVAAAILPIVWGAFAVVAGIVAIVSSFGVRRAQSAQGGAP